MLGLSAEIYEWFESFAPLLVGWTLVFTVLTTVRIIALKRRGVYQVRPSSLLTELAALPLTLLQSAFLGKAVLAGDVVSGILFLWWGLGFWLILLYLLVSKARGRKPDWYPYRLVISWLCKLNYLAFIIVFYLLDVPALMFVYSAWIMNDQYGMAFLSLDADRLRRTFDDYWIVRVLYPAGLLSPFVYPAMEGGSFYRIYGPVLLLFWIAGILHVHRRGLLRKRPDDPTLLRNMVYFAKADLSGPEGGPP